MVVFPNCKINLGLKILRKRQDGYHDLETVFYPLSINDALEIITAPELSITYSGNQIAEDGSENLCIQAYRLLKRDHPLLPPVHLHLHKLIPVGAGLGGGSSDAAFTLQLLNTKFQLQLSTEQLAQYALNLGSDCPFFIYNTPCVATGRGEVTKPISLSLSGYKIILVHPGIHISTAKAFASISTSETSSSIAAIIEKDIFLWKDHVVNDFEVYVFKEYPEIGSIKSDLYKAGAVYASLSGSGSAVYGIFPANLAIDLSFPDHYFVRELVSLA